MKKYEILGHIADLKIRAFGKDLPDLFINAALGMASQQIASPQKLDDLKSAVIWEKIKISSTDLNSLLVDWLNEILCRSDANERIYIDFQIGRLDEEAFKLEARIRGAAVKAKNIEIKAATYHDLDILRRGDHYEATIIFDV